MHKYPKTIFIILARGGSKWLNQARLSIVWRDPIES